jgi:hypothetical protein
MPGGSLGWRPRRGVERGPAAGLSAHGLPGARGASHKALDGGVNAEAAWADGVEEFAGQLDRLPDSTLRARAADVRDVGRRVLDRLAGGGGAGLVCPVSEGCVHFMGLAPDHDLSSP